jgi:hypothetical protein
MGPLPSTERGNRHIITWIDYFTKYPESMPIPTPDSKHTIQSFVELVVSRHGCPDKIITDKGSNFTSSAFQDAMKRWGTEVAYASTGHHQTNGLVERWNQTMQIMLNKLCDDHPEDWDLILPYVMMAYRFTPHNATGETPFRMNYGFDPKLPDEPRDLDINSPTVLRYVSMLNTLLLETWTTSLDKIRESQKTYKHHYDRHVGKLIAKIEEGTLVFVLADSARDKGFHPKFEPIFSGLFRVISVNDPNLTIRGLNNKSAKKDRIIHRDQVKPYVGNEVTYLNYLQGKDLSRRNSEDVCRICLQINAPVKGRKRRLQNWVACDGSHEPAHWFHMECVGLRKLPKDSETWYCPQCSASKP